MKVPISTAEISFARHWPKLAILILYFAVILSASLAHAMWRDEIQAWLIARDSADLSALFHNLHYEGHAALWYLLLLPLARFNSNPLSMQLLHVVIATFSVALVLWRAPLSRLEQVLFPFGYFFVFEYAIKSRGYALGCLFVFLFCAFWRLRKQSPVMVAIILALMANVDILFMIISIAAVLALAVDRLIGGSFVGRETPAAWQSDLTAVVIILFGWTLAVATALPPSDSGNAVGWLFGWSLSRFEWILGALRVLFTPQNSIWANLATGTILAIAFVRSRTNPPAATFLVVSVLGLLTFFYTKYAGGIWHHGLIFIVVFATVWIDRTEQESRPHLSPKHLVPAMFFGVILAFQVYGGVSAVLNDVYHPLSRARDVARFIVAKGWAAEPIVGFPDYAIAPIVGYLGIRQAYYPQGSRWGSFTIWDQRRLGPLNFDQALVEVKRFGSAGTWIAEAAADDPDLMRKYGFAEVANFSGAESENYIVYRRSADLVR